MFHLFHAFPLFLYSNPTPRNVALIVPFDFYFIYLGSQLPPYWLLKQICLLQDSYRYMRNGSYMYLIFYVAVILVTTPGIFVHDVRLLNHPDVQTWEPLDLMVVLQVVYLEA